MLYMNEELADYIIKHLHKGFRLSHLKDILTKHGFTKKDIKISAKKAAEYFINYLTPYIHSQLNRGLHPHLIHQYLLQSNYDPEIVHNAIKQCSKTTKSKTPFIFTIIILLLLVGGLFFFFNSNQKSATALMDIIAKKMDIYDEIQPGTEYNFKVEAINLGKAKEFDVKFTYYLLDMDGKVIDMKSESKAVSTSTTLLPKLTIPEDTIRGTYIIKVTAEYGKGQIAESEFTIYIEEKRKESTKITKQEYTDEYFEEISKNNPEQVLNICKELVRSEQYSKCISKAQKYISE